MHAAAVEFMDSEQMRVVQKYLPLRCPLSPHPFYVLVETSGSHDQHDKEVRVPYCLGGGLACIHLIRVCDLLRNWILFWRM